MSKTALELTREEWKQYNPGRNIRKWPPERRERAWEHARQAARLLRDQFGATRVVVFGSLAHNLWYSERSDIDMAVWGIAPEKFLKAFGAISDLSSEFEITLIDPKDSFPSIRESIRKHGIEV